MPQDKKRRKVSWSISKNNLTQKNANYSNKKEILTEEDKELAKQIDIHLDNSLVDLLIYKLKWLKQQKKLYNFLEYKGYYLFAKALEKKSLDLINYLIENLSKRHYYLMISYDNYRFIKEFIRIHKNLAWDNGFEHIIVPILNTIMKVEPNWELLEIIEHCLSDQSSPLNHDTVTNLKSCLNQQNKTEPDKKALFNTPNNIFLSKNSEEQDLDLAQESNFQIKL